MAGFDYASDRVKMEHKKQMMGSLIGLMHMGGFIGEEIRSMAEEVYPKEVLNAAYKYADVGPGFQTVLQETEKVYRKGRVNSRVNDYKEMATEEGRRKECARKWIMEQTAKYTAMREKSKAQRKGTLEWEEWDLNEKDRSLLYKMNALEYRIFELGNGLGENEDGKTIEEIAAMSEFNCEPDYIQEVQKNIRGIFVGRPESYFSIREASKEKIK